MATAMALTVFAGFAPTFYLRSAFGSPPTVTGATTLSPLAIMHGIVFTAWVALFLVQTSLVATRRVAVHRRLGIAGAVLALAMVVLGSITAIKAAVRGSAPQGANPLEFMAIPIGDMVVFATFVVFALRSRRDKETHKRLMLLAYISILGAAIGRLPGVLAMGIPVTLGLTMLFPAAGIVYDLISRRRVHKAYLWGTAFLVVSIPVRIIISTTSAWHALAKSLTGQ